ncbi:trypsin-like serine protease [Streptomyces sp. TRM43335]|uniref:Trypsin-like serine protease n=1 Tax=Streptomyces taklimakanensis TaxID=2569853 RepID=A0A6G2B755_9ACTN|nr:S1 family peptidase [Streptomyces taklimakanensis]MTE18091.1 trypsin-like serine protease [Streptomyces taklimakanensis]
MRRTSGVRTALSALLVLGTLTAAGTGLSTAVAAPSSPSAEPAPALVDAMERDLGLTEHEARERLRREARAAEIAPRAEKAAGAAFGGSWFDTRSGELVVGVTSRDKADEVRRTGAAPRVVEHSEKELEAAKERLDAHAEEESAPSGVSSWHVDPRSNSVVVNLVEGTERDGAVRAFLDEAREAGPVTVRESAGEAPRTFAAGVVGGDPYYTGNARCSIGFSVHGGFVTAGHCGRAGDSVRGWDGSQMGHFQGSSFPGNDYAFVSTGHGWWTVPVVLGWGKTSDVLVRGSAEAPVGASICRSGSTTQWHCGQVLAKNETVNYSQGAVHQMTKTSVCAEPGDSGGSFISGDQAQGVTSGGWGNCSGGGETWFQPVNEILSVYGLTLHTA